MFNTYNMGVGMSVVVAKEDEEKALAILNANGVKAYHLGEIIESQDKVVLS
jgi:phosphoribosylformylglycinamidine cyclo-ligase